MSSDDEAADDEGEVTPRAETLLEESASDLSESGSSTSESSRVLSPHAETLLEESGTDLSESGSSTSESSRVLPPHAETLLEESETNPGARTSSESSRIAPPTAETLLDESVSDLSESGSSTTESGRVLSPHADTLLETETGPPVLTPPSAKTLPIPEPKPKKKKGRGKKKGKAKGELRTLAQPSQSDLGRVPPADEPHERIGGYRIERELARGGMGVVYLGLDPNLGRKVAIKALLAGEFASEQALERFQIEARSAARLRHPGIVGIHEVGVEGQARHYLVMDFIEGGSLGERLEEKGPFEAREAAQLVATLSQAVAYAHGRGVIHRDLKPANVLLDAKGRPVVTDFGLAKEAERLDGPTHSGQLMGTPAYMPPEQARGEAVDLRVDVYSLGAILFECLTGRPPFEATSLPLLLSKLQDEEPAPLAKLGIAPDLATICATCLEKEPESRYASADALAADLERFLREEPIQARPPTLGHRARKWFRRNRSLAQSVGAVVLIAGLVGLAGTAWFVSRLRERTQEAAAGQRSAEQAASDLANKQEELLVQRDEAERQRQAALAAKAEALAQRDEAERQRQAAKQSEEDALAHLQASGQSMALLTDAVGGELAEIHDVRVRKVRERLLDQLMRELARFEAHPSITLKSYPLRAKIYLQRADLLSSQAKISPAIELYGKSIAIARIGVKEGAPRCEDFLQRGLVQQSIALSMRGDVAAATSASQEALGIARKTLAREPSAARRSVLVAALLRIGANVKSAGRFGEASERLQEAVKVARSGTEPDDARSLAGALLARGKLRLRLRDPDMAYEDFLEAAKIERARLETLPDLGPRDDLLNPILRALAVEEKRRGHRGKQVALLQEALTFARRRVTADAEDAEAVEQLVGGLQALASAKLAQGETSAAVTLLEEGVQRAQEHYAKRPTREAAGFAGRALEALVSLEEARNDAAAALTRAEALLVHWRAVSRKWKAPDVHQGLLAALEICSRLRRAEGDPHTALPLASEAVELQRKHLEERPQDATRQRNLAVVLEVLGSAQQGAGSLEKAQARFEESAALRRRLLREVPQDRTAQLDLAVILDRLGTLANTRRDHTIAHKSDEEATKLIRELAKGAVGKEMRANLAIVTRKLGRHASHDKDMEEARQLFLESKGLCETLLKERPQDGARALELAVALDSLAGLDQGEGKLVEAEAGFRKALRYYVALARSNPRSLRFQQSLSAGYSRLAMVLSERGKGEEALAVAKQSEGLADYLVSKVAGNLSLLRGQAVTRYQSAELQALHGDLEQARAFYASAEEGYRNLLKRAPHYAKEGAQFFEEIGEAKERIDWLQGKGAPTSGADWAGLAKLLAGRGENRDARAAYRHALAGEVPSPLEGKKRRSALLAAAALVSVPSPKAPPEALDEGPNWLREWAKLLRAETIVARATLAAAEGEEATEHAQRKLRGLERALRLAKESPKLEAYRTRPVWKELFQPAD